LAFFFADGESLAIHPEFNPRIQIEALGLDDDFHLVHDLDGGSLVG
jgi:hypothetical protein